MMEKLPFHEYHKDIQVIQILSQGKKPLRPAKTNKAFTRFGLMSQLWKYMTTCWAFDPTSWPLACDILDGR
ncbi:hypothetical protein FA15DRAFT_408109 [Coprinopsis marcescibilis]|uniref:Serine-threonine/tyrosine-protein kinase catalytic domain-containing protein n=1 Tax=Coprinopsis marcescibilis TaxID=230819 RepID=A0A5C3KAF8_COPMA|nr:hypothetical protein FA15DRAFT_408109 [Coprinopsis marcescibilis]